MNDIAKISFFFLIHTSLGQRYDHMDCSKAEYNRCVHMADPLVKEVHFIFPDNMNDIDYVCRTWNSFVDCLKKYTDRCFTEQQRRQFNKAVENPIESVHQMCTQPNYQKEYLRYAPCMKSTVTEQAHCGPQYSLLVEQVAQGEIISKATLCCSHNRFKQCVLKETQRICDNGVTDGPAMRFSAQIIDKALSFLQDQCFNYIPSSGDCATLTTDSSPFSDPVMISTSPSEVYPWSTLQDMASKDILPSRVTPPRPESTSSWLPSSNSPTSSDINSDMGSTQVLGSRTRPASYGRSNSWSDVQSTRNTQPVVNTVQMYSEPSSTSSTRSEWATVSSWHVINQSPGTQNDYDPKTLADQSAGVSSTETWYPAAGSQLNNEVDEPNQQGWVKPKNDAKLGKKALFSLTLVATVLTAFC